MHERFRWVTKHGLKLYRGHRSSSYTGCPSTWYGVLYLSVKQCHPNFIRTGGRRSCTILVNHMSGVTVDTSTLHMVLRWHERALHSLSLLQYLYGRVLSFLHHNACLREYRSLLPRDLHCLGRSDAPFKTILYWSSPDASQLL